MTKVIYICDTSFFPPRIYTAIIQLSFNPSHPDARFPKSTAKQSRPRSGPRPRPRPIPAQGRGIRWTREVRLSVHDRYAMHTLRPPSCKYSGRPPVMAHWGLELPVVVVVQGWLDQSEAELCMRWVGVWKMG